MQHTQQGCAFFDLRHAAERHLRPRAGRHPQASQGRRPQAVLRLHFQHHTVLVALREDGGDQTLTKGVVERVVNGLHTHAQAAGSFAVDAHEGLQTLVLPIRGHLTQSWMTAQSFLQARGPDTQLIALWTTEQETVLGPCHPVFQRQVLHGLQIQTHATHLLAGLRQALHDVAQRRIALVFGHQVDGHAPGVQTRVRTIDPNERGEAGHRRVLQQLLRQGLLTLGHGGKRGGLCGFGDALNRTGVLQGEKTFGHPHVQRHGQGHGEAKHTGGLARVVQHRFQRLCIAVNQGLQPSWVVHLGMHRGAQHIGTHHRRERERHHGRDENGHRQGEGELMEQAAHHIAHEQQRNQHRHQRKRQRQNREADLPCTVQGGLQGCAGAFRVLQITRDVLNHHDRVIHHKTGGHRQRHQGEVVDGKTRQVHEAKSAHQGQGYHHAGNDGGRRTAQKQKDDHHDQGHRQHQFKLHIAHRGADGDRAVRHHLHIQRRWQGGFQRWQQGLHTFHHINHIRARLTLDVEDDGWRVVGPSRQAVVLGRVDDGGDIAQAQRVATHIGQHQVGVLVHRTQLVVGIQTRGTCRPIQTALGHVHIGLVDGGAHILQ